MNTKNLLFAVFIFVFSESISAQVIFQRLYRGIGEYEGFFSEQTSDGGYIIAGRNFLVRTDSNGSLVWSKTYNNGDVKCVHQTSDGGYIMTGYAYSIANFYDGYVLKTDPLGNVLWSKTIGGPGYEEIFYVEETTDGGFILSGRARDSLNILHLYLVKLDGAGNQQWSKFFRDQTENKVKQTTDGGYIVAGTTLSTGSLFKTDSLGNLLWTKNYSDTYIEEFSFTDVQQTTDGGYIVSGSVRIPQTIIVAHFFLMKTDSSGNIVWQKAYAGNHTAGSAFYAVQQTSNGYVAAGLSTDFSDILRAAILVKTDTAGNLLWAKAYGDASDGVHFAKSVQQTTDGGYVLGGHAIPVGGMGSDKYFYLIKTDSAGNSGCREANITPWFWNTAMQAMTVTSTTSAGENSAPLTVTATNGASDYDYCYFVFTTDVQEYFRDTFTVYPNPAADQIHFTIASGDLKTIEIYNATGTLVLHQQPDANSQSVTIEISRFASGLYFIRTTDGKNIFGAKFVKQ